MPFFMRGFLLIKPRIIPLGINFQVRARGWVGGDCLFRSVELPTL